MNQKSMRIKMTYEDGQVFYWTVRRVPEAVNVGIGMKPRKITGWEYVSHDNCVRFSEGNWMDLVAAFKATGNWDSEALLANGQLIAAAPDMLSTLKALPCNFCGYSIEQHVIGGDPDRCIGGKYTPTATLAAKAAILKAGGG